VSRLRRIETADRYFFITTNLLRDIRELSPKERDICLVELAKARAKNRFSIFAYVVMPTHVHLLMWCGEALLPAIMRDWKSTSGFAIAKWRGRRGALWEPRYFDFILRRASDFGEKFEYIHRNPVVAGLVDGAADWAWSSAGFYAGRGAVGLEPEVFDVPCDPDTALWPVPWR
jgi:putative transposase